MGSEVTNIPSSSVDESSDLRRDLWGPRLYVKNKESQEQTSATNSKDFDAKLCSNTSSAEVGSQDQIEFDSHEQEVSNNLDSKLCESLSTEDQKQNEHDKSNSPANSPSKPTKVRIERLCRAASQPLPHANEKRGSNGKNVAKTSKVHSAEVLKNTKTRRSTAARKSLPHENVLHWDDDDDDGCSSPFSSSASTKSPNFQPTVAIAPSFICGERAAKRKEFYAKLEERRKALEAEKMEAEARAREEREAALKELRKNLYIKAKPVPSFYKEGPPPKPELKKIPPTRAKSPKLSRRRSLDDAAQKDNNGICYRLTRHSLDSKKDAGHKIHNGLKAGNKDSSNKERRKSMKINQERDNDTVSEVSQDLSQSGVNSENANESIEEGTKCDQLEDAVNSEAGQQLHGGVNAEYAGSCNTNLKENGYSNE